MRKYGIIATKRYKKDYKRILRSGYDVNKLEDIIDQLASEQTLPERCRDHALHGSLEGTRECHIGPDWLLHYAKVEDRLILILIATGDHRHVLGIE